MSYASMDHAWWIECSLKPRQRISLLGRTVANIIGYVGDGIYNCPIPYNKTDWTDDYYIKILWNGSMANWDFMVLSKLWILCHRKKIRVEISPCNPQYLKLEFWQRKTRSGSLSERLPDCEEVIKIIDDDFQGTLKEPNEKRT
ncbi:MAG: hypothetical protein A2161_13770 [Candidatus Schekmanbacteria bacterium RBG_13_48_7]|uniref:Uncharacterized protein n=1 Tax=Candidatus Schekmanbacteria bacterium RBG_13_48_7 TaxID=1817878 RepID=A0A1F7RZM8_9BACT|nr:MAG: hypothetical protein A2161_13770 [Candidatus Schekmanbacteria bacterium RBG_13_48_7]